MTAVTADPGFFSEPNYRRFELPWTRIEEEARRLRNAFLGVMGSLLIVSIIMPFLPVSKINRNTAQDIPPRLAKIVLEKKLQPPPPPLPPVVVAEQPLPAPPEAKQPQNLPKPVAVLPPETPLQKPQLPDPARTAALARAKARTAGLMAVADDLASLRQNAAATMTAGRTLSAAVASGEKTERSLITSKSGKRSTGVNTAALSRNTGGGGLAGRTTTTVSSPAVAARSVQASASADGVSTSGDYAGQRSQEEIETIFDRNKAAIYALYRRALRHEPSLQGKLVLQLTISPSGEVTDCSVVSSELGAPEFEQNLVKRVRMFDFGARDVETVTTTKPIDFFPA